MLNKINMYILEQKAVIDRFEESIAVLLVGEGEKVYHIPIEYLPSGLKEGDWVRLTISDGVVSAIKPDTRETENRRSIIEAKLDRLRKKQSNR